jgi:hypothetical protein
MSNIAQYNAQYVSLKRKLGIAMAGFPSEGIGSESALAEYISSLAKELDDLYIDDKYLGSIEEKINAVCDKDRILL